MTRRTEDHRHLRRVADAILGRTILAGFAALLLAGVLGAEGFDQAPEPERTVVVDMGPHRVPVPLSDGTVVLLDPVVGR